MTTSVLHRCTKGLHAIMGNGGSSDYHSMRVAGTVYLKKTDTMSVFVYSSSDTKFYAQSETGLVISEPKKVLICALGHCCDSLKPALNPGSHVML